MLVQTGKSTMMRCIAVRETNMSQHNGGRVEGPLKAFEPSQHYHNKNEGPHYKIISRYYLIILSENGCIFFFESSVCSCMNASWDSHHGISVISVMRLAM